MTGDSFHAFVADPSLLDKDSVLLLKELNSRYPFFRASQLLLAKNLRDLQHIDQRRQLHLAAVYAADRSLLQALLDGRHPAVSQPTEQSKVEAAPVVEEPRLPPAPSVSQPISSVEKSAENEVIESASIKEVEKTNSHPAPDTVNSAPLETKETGLSGESEEKTAAVHHDIDLVLEPVLYRVEDLLKEESVSVGEPEQPSTEVEEPEPDALPFDQWLTRLSVQTPRPLSVETVQHQSTIQNQQSTVSRPELKDNIALIEDFLSALPKEGQGKRAEFFKPSRAAERSNTPDPEAVSETLANIYMKQGQFESAAQAFDALAKRFPEKSSYFAARKSEALEKLTDQ
jgi:hypothetical protein